MDERRGRSPISAPDLKASVDPAEQCQILRRAVKTHNNRWKEIKKSHFPSRSSNDVKNQYVEEGAHATSED